MAKHDRTVEFEFGDRMLTAYCPAAAVFDIYEHFPGAADNIVKATGYLEPTRDGWDAACWLLAELCRWGELKRRQQGCLPEPMATITDFTLAEAADSARLREVVSEALKLAFLRFVPDDEPDEVDLVLQELEAVRKKVPPRGLFGRISSRHAPERGAGHRTPPCD